MGTGRGGALKQAPRDDSLGRIDSAVRHSTAWNGRFQPAFTPNDAPVSRWPAGVAARAHVPSMQRLLTGQSWPVTGQIGKPSRPAEMILPLSSVSRSRSNRPIFVPTAGDLRGSMKTPD